MTASMAAVLADHWGHSCGLDRCTCACGEPIGHWGAGGDMKAHQEHQDAMLSAAGFGDVREAAATTLEGAADALQWVKPESACEGAEACCGSAESCDAMRGPSTIVVGANWLRARAAAVRGGE